MDIVTNIKDDDTWDDPTAIVMEEATERSVVALGMAQQSIFVVRPWSTAVLVPYQQAAPTQLSEEQRLIREFDRVALAMAGEFAEDLQVLRDTVWTIIAQGRLVLDYATIDACKTEIFSNFRHEYNVELPTPVARAIEKQYYAFQKALAALPFEWYTRFLGEPWNDASRATTTTCSATTIAAPPLGFHGRLAASSCVIRVLEDACRLFLARSLVLSAVSKHGHKENLHIYLAAVSMLHTASTTATPSAIPLPSPSSNKSTVASNYHSFLDTFLARQSSTTNETLHQHSSYAGRTLHWTRRSFLSLLGMTVSPSDPVFALIAPHGTIPDPQLALVALAPHMCLADASRSHEDDPTALLTARCLLRVAATISTTTAAHGESSLCLVGDDDDEQQRRQ